MEIDCGFLHGLHAKKVVHCLSLNDWSLLTSQLLALVVMSLNLSADWPIICSIIAFAFSIEHRMERQCMQRSIVL